MNEFLGSGDLLQRDELIVWFFAILFVLIGSSLILYVEPSFPVVVTLAYSIEVFLYANLYIYSRRLWNARPRAQGKAEDIFQIEQDT